MKTVYSNYVNTVMEARTRAWREDLDL